MGFLCAEPDVSLYRNVYLLCCFYHVFTLIQYTRTVTNYKPTFFFASVSIPPTKNKPHQNLKKEKKTLSEQYKGMVSEHWGLIYIFIYIYTEFLCCHKEISFSNLSCWLTKCHAPILLHFSQFCVTNLLKTKIFSQNILFLIEYTGFLGCVLRLF